MSTESQDIEDGALERQAEKIRNFCLEHEIICSSIFGDVASAVQPRGSAKQFGFVDAVTLCLRQKCPLIVTDLNRIDRGKKVGVFLLSKGVQIISIKDGGFVTEEQVRVAAARGELGARNIREGTVRELGKLRAAGVRLGSPGDKAAAARVSADVRSERSRSVTDKIMAVLEEDEANLRMSLKDLADLLNTRGIQSSRRNIWTKASVKRQAKQARDRISERQRHDPYAADGQAPTLEELEALRHLLE